MSGVQTVFDRIAFELAINAGGKLKTIVTMQLLDGAGNVTGPYDLSNHDASTFRSDLADNDGNKVASLTVTVVDAPNGKIQLELGPADTWAMQTDQSERDGSGDVFADLNGEHSFVCAFFWRLEVRVTAPVTLVTAA